MCAAPLLEVDRLTRRFGDRVAVDQVSFEIAPGETYGLLGPNGAGKTTTISMIAGVLRPDGGGVTIAGQPLASGGAAKSAIGLVPQDIALYDELSAVENLRFFGRLNDLGGKELDRRIAEVLETVALTDRAKDRISEYSGGMKRRANIAAGLLHGPRLLILDEPTAGVDPQSRNQILAAIEQLGGAGLSVLYTTHYMEEAERLCHRIGIIDSGKLIAQGTQRELVALTGAQDQVVMELAAGTTPDALEPTLAAARALPGVADAVLTDQRLVLTTDDAAHILAGAVAAVSDRGAQVQSVEVRRPDLETVFLTMTGRALRDVP